MNIALLKCGYVPKTLLKVAGDFEDMFAAFFERYVPQIRLTVFDVQKNQYPKNLKDFDGFITTGSENSVYDDFEWLNNFKKFINLLYYEHYKHAGICFGHQLIAGSLGGKVEKSATGWGLGVKKINVLKTKSWMNGDKLSQLHLIASHQDQVIKLPPYSEVIAGSDYCPVSIFTVSDRFLGIQLHPEFTAAYHKASLLYHASSFDEALLENALKSLDQQTDSKVIAGWINNFFQTVT